MKKRENYRDEGNEAADDRPYYASAYDPVLNIFLYEPSFVCGIKPAYQE